MPRLDEDRRRAVLGPMGEKTAIDHGRFRRRRNPASKTCGCQVSGASDLLLSRLASFQSVEGGGSGAVLCGLLHLCLPFQYQLQGASAGT